MNYNEAELCKDCKKPVVKLKNRELAEILMALTNAKHWNRQVAREAEWKRGRYGGKKVESPFLDVEIDKAIKLLAKVERMLEFR